jgi:hypothetical protein
VRLVFSYEGDEVRLVSRQRVEMIPPAIPSLTPERAAGARAGSPVAGCWFEVRDAQDRALLQQPMEDPIRRDVEVFSPEPGRSLSRRPQANPRGTFVLLVPDLPEGRDVVLLAAPLTPTAGGAAAATADTVDAGRGGGARGIVRVSRGADEEVR